MQLAASAALARIPYNLDRLWDETDPHYALFVQAVFSEVAEAHEQARNSR